MQPLTIVHASTERQWHGGEEQARLLIRGLAERGHRAYVFARQGGEFARRMADEGFEVLPVAGSGRSLRAILHICGQLRRIRPQVIHFHDSHALSGAGLAAWRLPIAARVVSRKVLFPVRSAWRYRLLSDRVVAVSQAVADVCQASGIDSERIRIVHDGVDPARAALGNRARGRQSLGVGSEQIVLLTVASLTDPKGHTYLLQALPQVLAQYPQTRVALAGDGELRPQLQAEAHRRGLSENVMFLGYRHDIPDLLQAADLFVLPSHSEGLCSTLIDVMLARVPIVTTSAGGIPDLVGRPEQPEEPVAWMVPPRDPQALAAAILAALASPTRSRALVDRAEQRARSCFTADRMVERTLAVYEELLRRS